MNNKAFTLIEVLIVIIILGIGLIGALTMIGRSYEFLSNTRSKLVAINLARGGVEQVYNIRNSNRQRRGGKSDECWLKINPFVDKDDDGCGNDEWFSSGYYVLLPQKIPTGNQQYFTLSGMSGALKTDGLLTNTDRKFLLVKNDDGFIQNTTGNLNKRPDNYFSSSMYFQQVRGGYLQDKNNQTILTCNNGTDNPVCSDGRFLEKNFCVDVVYFNKSKKLVSLCSLMTNFKK